MNLNWLSFIKFYKIVKLSIVVGWLKNMLKEVGVDIGEFLY